MKTEARILGKPRLLDLRSEGGRIRGKVGEREVDAKVTEKGPGTLMVRIQSRNFDVTYSSDGTGFLMDLGGPLMHVEIPDPRSARLPDNAGESKRGRQEIRAAMPGKVVAVKVKAGEDVRRGQGLVVVEAMKMENEVSSPKTGKVVTVGVVLGQTVETGALLAAVE